MADPGRPRVHTDGKRSSSTLLIRQSANLMGFQVIGFSGYSCVVLQQRIKKRTYVKCKASVDGL